MSNNQLTDVRRWELEPWRQPKLTDDDELIRSEHGRIAHNIDYRSHWFVLVKQKYGGHALLVQHGGGEERLSLGYTNGKHMARIIQSISSDDAYLLMHGLFDVHKQATQRATQETTATYRKAFVDGRLRKRRLPAQGVTKVWIESEAHT